MTLLRPISILLRNTLIKQHPYFSCCASCGEIRTPLANRLCASLVPNFPVDGLLVQQANTLPVAEEISLATQNLKKYAPWLRRIYLVAEALPETSLPAGLALLPPSSFCPEQTGLPPQAWLHTVPELAEQYLAVPPETIPEQPLHPLDFFTPNGIPLVMLNNSTSLPAALEEPLLAALACALNTAGLAFEPQLKPALGGITAHNKENTAAFSHFVTKVPTLDDSTFNFALAHYMYASGRVVPKLANTSKT